MITERLIEAYSNTINNMKKGLKNRFPERVEQFWKKSDYWYECANCEKAHADCTHHIISPTSFDYIKGNHNESVFNSCRLNNENCHLHKPMQNRQLQEKLLKRTYEIVMEAVDNNWFELSEKDYRFIRNYKKFYDFL